MTDGVTKLAGPRTGAEPRVEASARGAYELQAQEPFALDTRLHRAVRAT